MTTEELSKLTPEQKRLKIAETLGFKIEVDTARRANAKTRIWMPDGRLGSTKAGKDDMALKLAMDDCVPDFLNDLNAMAEAEKTLDARDKHHSSRAQDYATVVFSMHLRKIVGGELREIITNDGMSTYGDATPFEAIKLIRATASQRADAFLLTI